MIFLALVRSTGATSGRKNALEAQNQLTPNPAAPAIARAVEFRSNLAKTRIAADTNPKPNGNQRPVPRAQ